MGGLWQRGVVFGALMGHLPAITRVNEATIGSHDCEPKMCDIVVHLDANLRMTQPCPKLSSLLLHGSASSLNQDFLNLIPLSEQDRFVQHMKAEESFNKSIRGRSKRVR
jgi:hypothetical protein